MLNPTVLSALFGDRKAPDGVPVANHFAGWFADSKIVDADGFPLRLYHGTAGEFDGFSAHAVGSRHMDLEVGPAFYFTASPAQASWYARSAAAQSGGGAHVLAVYLSLQNPLVVDFQGTGIETLAEDIRAARNAGHDGLVAIDYDDGDVATHYIAFDPWRVKSAFGGPGFYHVGSSKLVDWEAMPAVSVEPLDGASCRAAEGAARALALIHIESARAMPDRGRKLF